MPDARRAKDDLLVDGFNTFRVVDDGIDRVFHHGWQVMVGEGHVGTGSHIVFGIDDFAIASDHDLVDVSQVFKVDVLGRVGPSQRGGIVEVAVRIHLKVLRLHGHIVIDIGRHIVEYGLCPTCIVDFVNHKPTVAAAAPTPVEVEEVVVVVAVANESVSAIVAEARIIYRPANVELVFEHVLPVGERVFVAALEAALVGVGEIMPDGVRHIPRIGTTAAGREVHVDGHAAMVHEQGHGLDFLLGGATEAVGHQVPLVGGGTKVGRLGSVAVAIVRMAARALQRVVPAFHHLAHGRGHAARIATTA